MSSAFSKKVFEDSNGLIWICTQDGLNRYDGRNFVIYRKGAEPDLRLIGNDIIDIAEDNIMGKIWVITGSGGLSCIDSKTYKVIRNVPIVSPVKGKVIWLKQLEVNNGIIWIGTDEGLYRFNSLSNRLTFIDLSVIHPQPFAEIDVMSLDHDGLLWMGLANGCLAVLRTSDLTISFFDGRFKENTYNPESFLTFSSFKTKLNETHLIASSAGIFTISFSKKIEIKELKLPFLNESYLPIYSAGFVKNSIWIATAKGIFFLDEIGKIHAISDSDLGYDENWYRRTIDIFEDRTGNVWLSVPNGVVLIPAMHNIFKNYFLDPQSGVKINRSYILFPFSENEIFAAGDDGLYHIFTQTSSIKKILKNEPAFYVDTLFNGIILACGENGVRMFEGGNKFRRVSSLFPVLIDLDTLAVNSFVCFGDSLVFFCLESAGTVYQWDVKRNKASPLLFEFDYRGDLAGLLNEVKKIDQTELFILGDNALYKYNIITKAIIKKQYQDPDRKTSIKNYFDIEKIGNRYYLATYENGILELDSELSLLNFLQGEKGKRIPGVYKVVSFEDSLLYTTTNNGLYIYNTTSKKYLTLFEGHGLQTHQFEEGCAIKSGNRIFAGGINGFQEINPTLIKNLKRNYEIKFGEIKLFNKNVVIERIRHDLEKQITINPEINTILIESILPSYGDNSYIQFYYSIGENGQGWTSNGSQNKFQLIEPAPGTYNFQVKAETPLGGVVYSNILKFEVLPPWYQTTWFYALCGLTAVGLGYALYRYRLYQIHKEYRFKEKIAADLHDDLGSTITGIKMFTDLGVSTGSPQYYAPVKQGLTDAALALREMIWVLDNKTNTAADILRRIEQNSLGLLKEKEISLQINMDPQLDLVILKTDEKRDLYLILKEFINNSVKYSGCTEMGIVAKRNSKRMYFEIFDNGTGFDIDAIRQGNGLFNMKARAKRCGYNVTFNTAAGMGTRLILSQG